MVNLYEKTKTFQKLDAKLAPEHFPGCEDFEMKSEAYYECLIRMVTVTLAHPCCTAPMGIKGSPKAVVDSELRFVLNISIYLSFRNYLLENLL